MLGTLNESARWASIGLQTAVGIAAGFLPGAGLWDAVQLLGFGSGQGGFWETLGTVVGALPVIGGAVKALRAIGKAQGFRRAANHAGALARACARLSSFVAGTTVETPDGPIPIEQLRPGDEILTRDDADPATLAPEAGYVKRIFKRIAPAVVWLTLLDGTTIGVTPEHEVYTEAQGWRYVSELETSASLVDASGAPLTIVAIEIDPTPRPVYNLETSCGTYFAQGVWAHNCVVPPIPRRDGWWRWSDDGVEFEAFIERNNRGRLTLHNVDLAGEVGTGTWKDVFDQIKSHARGEGLIELRIIGDRITGAAEGARDIIIRLD